MPKRAVTPRTNKKGGQPRLRYPNFLRACKLLAFVVFFVFLGRFVGSGDTFSIFGYGEDNTSTQDTQDKKLVENAKDREIVNLTTTSRLLRKVDDHRILANAANLEPILKRLMLGKPVFITMTPSSLMEMARNWYHHTKKSGIENILIASLDSDMHKECERLGIPSHTFFYNLENSSDEKNDIGILKTALALTLLELGWDVAFSEVQSVWLSDPQEVFSVNGQMGAADALFSSDSISISNDLASMKADWAFHSESVQAQDWFLKATPRAGEYLGSVYTSVLNTGAMFLRASQPTIVFCQEWFHFMRTDGKSHGVSVVWGDQHGINHLARIKMNPIKVVEPAEGQQAHNRIIWAYNHTLKLGILSPAEFCNGHIYFVQRRPQFLRTKVYVVHNTFQFYDEYGQIARYRDEGLWLEDPKEYYTEGNYLSFDIELPGSIGRIENTISKHRAAMEFYYEATRKAFAIAKISKRILILPKVICFCDSYWNALLPPCRFPGSDVDPPFLCPADHFMNPYFWRKLQYRHSHFLRIHKWTLKSWSPKLFCPWRVEVACLAPMSMPLTLRLVQSWTACLLFVWFTYPGQLTPFAGLVTNRKMLSLTLRLLERLELIGVVQLHLTANQRISSSKFLHLLAFH